MVAVGDPALVSVTVKGADVLLKAVTSSGSTNAFIWLGGRYTQWTFTVRNNTKDPRLIIVRDLAARSGARAEPRRISGGPEQGGNPATNLPAAPIASGQTVNGTLVGSLPPPPSVQPPSGRAAPSKPAAETASEIGACRSPVALDHFMRMLTARQRDLFGAFLTTPSLATLQLLFLELSAQQRCSLLALLSAPSTSGPSSAGLHTPIASGAGQTDGNPDAMHRGEERASRATCGTSPTDPGSEGIHHGDSPMDADTVFAVTPHVVDGRLLLYYVLENHGEATLLTDVLRLRITDGSGQRVGFAINRATREGYLGRLETGGVEYGLIAADTAEKLLVLEWNLVGFGSGKTHVARAAVQVP